MESDGISWHGFSIADILGRRKNAKSWDGKELGLSEEQEGDQWSKVVWGSGEGAMN